MQGSYWIINLPLGGNYITNINDYIGYHIHVNQAWEPHLTSLYSSILTPDYEVVDIGAHMGYHTIQMAQRCRKVTAFEPQVRLYNQLRGNIFINELEERIESWNVGLGERYGRSSFGGLERHTNQAGIVNYGGRSLEDSLPEKDIEIRPLDSFRLRPNMIKIDVEGYELKVLRGGLETIQSTHPTLLIECWKDNRVEVFRELQLHGYQIYNIPYVTSEDDFIAVHPYNKESDRLQSIIKQFTLPKI